MTAEQFRDRLVEINRIDADTMMAAGIREATRLRQNDPETLGKAFLRLTADERAKFSSPR